MKKFVFTLLLVFVCHLGYAQSINGLFNEFGNEKNADCVKVSSFMMSLGKMFAGHDEDAEIIRKIKSIKVLDLESCTQSVKERFSKKVNRLSLKGYDELMRVNDEGEKVRVLMKAKKGNYPRTAIRMHGKRGLYTGTDKRKIHKGRYRQISKSGNKEEAWTPLSLNNNSCLTTATLPDSLPADRKPSGGGRYGAGGVSEIVEQAR